MRKPRPGMLFALIIAGILHGFVGCAKDDVEEARKKMQEGQAETNPHAGTMPAPKVGSSGPNDGAEIPLKTTGLGSAAELTREVAKLQDARAAAHFEQAFRLTFTSDPAKRNYHEAEQLLASVMEARPDFAPAYRVRGYAKFNMNPMEPAASLADYEKAAELDPKYGEAHYAIAFMCAATGERDKGIDHYRKAMELGVEDERNIGKQFYADLLQKQ